jgi:hypothetical protein
MGATLLNRFYQPLCSTATAETISPASAHIWTACFMRVYLENMHYVIRLFIACHCVWVLLCRHVHVQLTELWKLFCLYFRFILLECAVRDPSKLRIKVNMRLRTSSWCMDFFLSWIGIFFSLMHFHWIILRQHYKLAMP